MEIQEAIKKAMTNVGYHEFSVIEFKNLIDSNKEKVMHEAMKVYAESEAINFANWLQYQKIERQTTEELYKEFKNSI